MDALEINYRLKRAGLSQTAIARELGVSQSVVGNVIHNRITAFEVASYIARALGEELTALWPDRYTFKPRGRRSASRRADAQVTPCAEGEAEQDRREGAP
ncbi:MAG: helix-turn-helix domain-containing protein [Aquabacterium sp.]|uniref:helix-turn-helix domain-containing protein n=1 Tax=Aquabacterium sp. TaxID=1872578 RepID=UPI0027188B98|nr:helix-turn-helix domain-containing protein [Aquabacterium sp.]MDO9004367.1 helix-turn-helix domain-containing protein [Aquabacterium sp.]